MSTKPLSLDILPQPDDTTCGPTCLHAVYRYHGDDICLATVIDETVALRDGGTLAVLLGCHALARGYRATLHTYNLTVFDPSWFAAGVDIAAKLAEQLKRKQATKLRTASEGYLRFLALGGELRQDVLDGRLIASYLERGLPVLTGLSATYLYGCQRETGDCEYDDVAGEPTGHFVVVTGYDATTGQATVADPLANNPGFAQQRYQVSVERLLAAILLGVMTYDGNLLVVEPRLVSHA